ncbi:MAG: DUF1501 domain-containing protein [Planctomicrobium sp.]|jgi:hypothetical protein|nr:DUF1501 domain-containing protein [Planctomicrobium sp.]
MTYPTDFHHHYSRREMLLQSGTGFGALALASMLPNSALADSTASISHIAPRAKSVIFCFMEGGPSHMDTFDPKPELQNLAGQPLPAGYKRVVTAMGEINSPLLASKRKWKQHGEAGTWVSDWLPNIATCVDDMAVIRSCWTNGINHSGGVCQMNTGTPLAGRPSLGAWVNYGLGSENANLPAFVVMTDNKSQVTNGPRNWGTGFMPSSYQGTKLSVGDEPIANLNNPKGISVERQRQKLDLLNDLNKKHMKQRPFQTDLEARIKSYELAFRMQANAPEAIDLESETEATQQLYGLDDAKTEAYGRNCLLARRLVERGVRFVQLYSGAGSKWDAHSDIENNHTRMCGQTDKPVAGLIKDLKQRGLLDETLVVWGGEFGRTPMSEKGDGRDHNPTGFTMFMAGGGVAGGQTIGATDDLGFHAVEDRLHVHDLHATILYLLGIDHMKLTYLHKGRPERPTQNEGDSYRLITQRSLS